MPEEDALVGECVRRPEFERHLDEFKAVEKQVTRHEVLLSQQAAIAQEQNRKLETIQVTLDRQAENRNQRDQAIKNAIWAANTIGPKALGIVTLALAAIYAWMKGHLG